MGREEARREGRRPRPRQRARRDGRELRRIAIRRPCRAASLEGPLPPGPDDQAEEREGGVRPEAIPSRISTSTTRRRPSCPTRRRTNDPARRSAPRKPRRCSIARRGSRTAVDDAVARDPPRRPDARRRRGRRVHAPLRSAASRRTRSSRARWDELAAQVAPRVARRPRARGLARSARSTSARSSTTSTSALDGVRLELRVTPLARVGLYVPGGTARYPSSVLMTAIPAKVAGVPRGRSWSRRARRPRRCSPRGSRGVDRVFEIGGAQAVARARVRHADRPARRQDRRPRQRVGRDRQAPGLRRGRHRLDRRPVRGPDHRRRHRRPGVGRRRPARPGRARSRGARDPGHDVARALAAAVAREVARQLATLPRRAIAEHAIDHHGAAVIVASIDEAVAFANRFAPEHLELDVAEPRAVAARCSTAGAIFLGKWSSEAAGDYLAGANHVLPTGGAARYASPLGVHDFRKRTSLIEYTEEAARAHADAIATLAACEGLDAHGRSALRREMTAERSLGALEARRPARAPRQRRVPRAAAGEHPREARRQRAAVRAARPTCAPGSAPRSPRSRSSATPIPTHASCARRSSAQLGVARPTSSPSATAPTS